jgi:hypothetical protein
MSLSYHMTADMECDCGCGCQAWGELDQSEGFYVKDGGEYIATPIDLAEGMPNEDSETICSACFEGEHENPRNWRI